MVEGAALLLQWSLEEWPSILQEMRDGVLVVDSLYAFRFGLLYNLHLKLSGLLKTFLLHCISSSKIYKKTEKVESTAMAASRACILILTHVERKYALSGLRVHFTKVEQSAHLSGLLTGSRARGMMAERICQAVDVMLQFAASNLEIFPDFLE